MSGSVGRDSVASVNVDELYEAFCARRGSTAFVDALGRPFQKWPIFCYQGGEDGVADPTQCRNVAIHGRKGVFDPEFRYFKCEEPFVQDWQDCCNRDENYLYQL